MQTIDTTGWPPEEKSEMEELDRLEQEYLELQKSQEMPLHQQQALLEQFELLASRGRWSSLLKAAKQALAHPGIRPIIHQILRYCATASEQLEIWDDAASSWQTLIIVDGATPDEEPLLMERAILCLVKGGKLDEAENLLYSSLSDYEGHNFAEAREEFRRMNYRLCFEKPENERLESLLNLPAGDEAELSHAERLVSDLLQLCSASVSDIIHRMNRVEFIILYEFCRSRPLEERFGSVMSNRCAFYIQQDREWLRCKLDAPCYTMAQARWVWKKVERLAKASRRRHVGERYNDTIYHGTIYRLV